MWEPIIGDDGELYYRNILTGAWYRPDNRFFLDPKTGQWTELEGRAAASILQAIVQSSSKPTAPTLVPAPGGATGPQAIPIPGLPGHMAVVKPSLYPGLPPDYQIVRTGIDGGGRDLGPNELAVAWARLRSEAERDQLRDDTQRFLAELQNAQAEAQLALNYYQALNQTALQQGNQDLAFQAQQFTQQVQQAQLELQAQALEIQIGQQEINRTEVLSRLAANPRDFVQYFNLVRPDLGGTVLDPKGTIAGGEEANPADILRSAPGVADLIGLSPLQNRFGIGEVPGRQALVRATPTERGVAESFVSAGGIPIEDYQDLISKFNPESQFAQPRTPIVSGG